MNMIKIKNVNLVNSELSMIMTIKKLTVQSRFQIFYGVSLETRLLAIWVCACTYLSGESCAVILMNSWSSVCAPLM